MKNLIKAIYDSEINLQISWFWDGGFTVKVGDEMNGFKEEFHIDGDEINELEKLIEEEVKKLYPTSGFAKTYNSDPFRKASLPLIEYLGKNHDPHTSAIVSYSNAELLQGIKSTGNIEDYIPD